MFPLIRYKSSGMGKITIELLPSEVEMRDMSLKGAASGSRSAASSIDDTAEEDQRAREGQQLVHFVYACAFSGSGTIAVSGLVTPILMDEFSFTLQDVATLASIQLIGYTCTPILGGYSAERVLGGTKTLALGVLGMGIMMCVAPLLYVFDPFTVMAVRSFFFGFSAGCIVPALISAIAQVLTDAARDAALATNGAIFLSASGFTLLVDSGLLLLMPWMALFVFHGCFCIIVAIIGRTQLPQHMFDPPVVKHASNRSEAAGNKSSCLNFWCFTQIFTIFMTYASGINGMTTFMGYVPLYYVKELNLGFFAGVGAAIPWFATIPCVMLSTKLAVHLYSNGWSLMDMRRLFIFGSHGIPALCMFLATVAPEPICVVLLITVAVGLQSVGAIPTQGYVAEVAGPHLQTISGAGESLGNLSGAFIQAMLGSWMQETGNVKCVFQFTAGLYLVALVFYLTFLHGDPICPTRADAETAAPAEKLQFKVVD